MSATIKQVSQSFSPGRLIELYQLDLSNMGGGVTYWSNTSNGNNSIVFNGNVYIPKAMECTGFEWTGNGAIPQPTMNIFADQSIRTAMIMYGDFLGAKVTRIKTFSRFLDGEPDADPDQRFPDEIYYIAQKQAATKELVTFKLMSALEVSGIKLPKRICLKDTCPLKYRMYNADTGTFIYVDPKDGGCPYCATGYFDASDNSTTIDKDVCGKKLTSCKARYGEGNVLPFLGFPGLTPVGVNP